MEIENSTSATLGVHLTYGLTMASYRPHIWSGANYPVFTIYKDHENPPPSNHIIAHHRDASSAKDLDQSQKRLKT
ncbi:uncharacterized protein LOC109123264 [Vitis vinifera]|uniref:uncharacterized protein LOC109123264 n=1 Tax=Vitis vinifera TaxID=29760 RepID=UPI001FC43079|nr:uncharacterized protein LOC109123264 [Vitis vinifera]